jgi:phosphoribulokinase
MTGVKTSSSRRRYFTAAPCSGRREARTDVDEALVAITGSSGAGLTTVMRTFQQIFRREKILAAIVEGDAFNRYDRAETIIKLQQAREQGE